MTENTQKRTQAHLPDTSSQLVCQRWLDLFDWSYGSGRVTGQEIEPGVHVIVVSPTCKQATDRDLIEAEVRVTSGHVPEMARGLRLTLGELGNFSMSVSGDYHGWMGDYGKDIASGEADVLVFVDLAYLEAALLARLWDHEVIVDFDSPLAFFRRGALTDYVNIHEAVVAMVANGRSLADTADHLASGILNRLQLYAAAFFQLSCLYTQVTWHIDRDNFFVRIPGSRRSVALQYWQLRENAASVQRVMRAWRDRIEDMVEEASFKLNDDVPKSFAA